MVDFLHLTGQRLLALGYNSPFLVRAWEVDAAEGCVEARRG